MKLLPLALALSLSLTGCAATGELTSAQSCEQISKEIDSMISTFEDQSAGEGEIRLTLSNASGALAQTAKQSQSDLAPWATELSEISSKLAQAIADGDGNTTLLSVNELFTSFEKESELCPAK